MPATQNPLKRALREGRPQIGLWLALGSPYAAEVCATAGFDWLLVDGEHAPNDLPSMLAQLQAIGETAHAVVRVAAGEAWMIKQVLDIGAQSVVVPMVESADQARALVRAVRYAPAGMRGVGASLARAARFGGIADYVTTADAEICLILQVESRAGLAALPDILEVEGVDGVFIGPADLAADMGFPGDAGRAEVQEAIAAAIARIRGAGRGAGILTFDQAAAHRWLERGVTFLAVGADITLLATGARGLAKAFGRG